MERLFPVDSPLPPRLAKVLGLSSSSGHSPNPSSSAVQTTAAIASPGYTDMSPRRSSSDGKGALLQAGTKARRSLGTTSDKDAAMEGSSSLGAGAAAAAADQESASDSSSSASAADADDEDEDGSPTAGAGGGRSSSSASAAAEYMPEELANKTRLVAYESVSVRQARKQGGKYRVIRERAFLVKWMNLPDSYNTWEFATDLDDDAKVLAYRRRSKPPSTARLDPGRRLMGCTPTQTAMQLAGMGSGSAGLFASGSAGGRHG